MILDTSSAAVPLRLYSLDALRGLAALVVVFSHWNHWFFDGITRTAIDISSFPWGDTLHLLYAKGGVAVNLFFMLSGFIFFWLYSAPIRAGSVGIARFTQLRLSRLYPLHALTLIAAAAGQAWYASQHGSYFVYAHEDGYHFMLQMLFASSWGLERGLSFNGPVWSVSVEMLLYLMFFLCCRTFAMTLKPIAIVASIGFALVLPLYAPLGVGVGCFFAGGALQNLYVRTLAGKAPQKVMNNCAVAALVSWAVIIAADSIWPSASLSLRSVPLLWRYESLVNAPALLACAFTIMALALWETSRGPIGKPVALLGDISYSSYLLHFPLQLLCVSLASAWGIDQDLFRQPYALVGFFAVLIGLSLASHRLIELPAQHWLRQVGRRSTRLPECKT